MLMMCKTQKAKIGLLGNYKKEVVEAREGMHDSFTQLNLTGRGEGP
jgi:hypothetical protein